MINRYLLTLQNNSVASLKARGKKNVYQVYKPLASKFPVSVYNFLGSG